MKRVNLLADEGAGWVLPSHKSRCQLLLGAACVSVAIWSGAAFLHVRSLDAEIARLSESLPALQQEQDRRLERAQERDALAAQLEWLTSVRARADVTDLIAAIGAAVPEHAFLTHLSLDPLHEGVNDRRIDAIMRGVPTDFEVRLRGAASDDVAQTVLLQSLLAEPCLRDVRLLESGTVGAGEGDAMERHFVVTVKAGCPDVVATPSTK